MRLGRQQTAQSSVKVWRRPALGSTKISFSSPQNAQLYVTVPILCAVTPARRTGRALSRSDSGRTGGSHGHGEALPPPGNPGWLTPIARPSPGRDTGGWRALGWRAAVPHSAPLSRRKGKRLHDVQRGLRDGAQDGAPGGDRAGRGLNAGSSRGPVSERATTSRSRRGSRSRRFLPSCGADLETVACRGINPPPGRRALRHTRPLAHRGRLDPVGRRRLLIRIAPPRAP